MKKTLFSVLLLASRGFCGDLFVPSQYPTIQSAIDAASPGDRVIIAPGTYTGPGNWDIDFRGKSITVRSTDPNDPNVVDATIVDCNEPMGPRHRGFIFNSGEAPDSVLDGLTITNAGLYGIYCYSISSTPLSPTIRNCNIMRNATGILCSVYGKPTIASCRITDNGPGTPGSAGGIYSGGTGATIIGCEISRNRARDGAGIRCHASSGTVTIIDCTITGNEASGYGGGIYVGGPTVVTDCTIADNTAAAGGGISNWAGLQVTRSIIVANTATGMPGGQTGGGGIHSYLGWFEIRDSIVAANRSSTDGGALYAASTYGSGVMERCTVAFNVAEGAGGGAFLQNPVPFRDCIFWGNSAASGTGPAAQITSLGPGINVTSSCIQDEDPNDANAPFGGEENGNIDDDPMFVRMPNDGGDGWGVGNNDDYGDLHLRPDSPCIDAGTPLIVPEPNIVDIDGQPRGIGLAVDMGADEYALFTMVTRPKGGEVWATGSKHRIDWFRYGVNSVDILFSSDDGENWQAIQTGISDSNSYVWQLPRSVDSNQCVISVLPGNGDANVVTVASGLFSISHYPRRPPVPPGWAHKCRLPGPDLSGNVGPKLGCVKWVFETAGPVSSRVAVGQTGDDYGIYVACEDGLLYALDNEGNLLWSYDAGTPIVGSPAVGYYGMVYAAGENGKLYAIDDDGHLRWTHTTDGPIYSTPAVGCDGKIYARSLDGYIYALGADGSELWTFATRGLGKLKGEILASPAFAANATVYVAGLYDPNLYALDSNDGVLRWVCNFEHPIDPCDPNKGAIGGWPVAPPAIGPDGTIYQALVHDKSLYAIDADTGGIRWSLNLADPCSQPFDDNDYAQRFGDAGGWCEPAFAPDGTIYIGLDDPYLRAIRPDGSIRWITRLGMVGGFTATVGRDGLIYAASDDGFLCAVNPQGEEVARFKGDGWLSYPVIAPDDTLIASDSNNRIWAIAAEGCEEQQPALHAPADIQPNRAVDYLDLALLVSGWLECTDPYNPQCGSPPSPFVVYPAGDVDRNWYVNFTDYTALAQHWLGEQ